MMPLLAMPPIAIRYDIKKLLGHFSARRLKTVLVGIETSNLSMIFINRQKLLEFQGVY